MKLTSKMSYEVHISDDNVSAYLQCFAMLKVLMTVMLEKIILSLLPKLSTMIEPLL